MKFPNFVYKSPGKHQCPGGTFDALIIKDGDELLDAANNGYYPTIELAVKKPSPFDWNPYIEENANVDSSHNVENGSYLEESAAEYDSQHQAIEPVPADPTREELESQAKELGIGFNARTSDEVLAERIKNHIEV